MKNDTKECIKMGAQLLITIAAICMVCAFPPLAVLVVAIALSKDERL
jgi:hypothetical protein